MKISDNIIVGVEYKKLCDFYSTIYEYVNRFISIYPDLNESTLIGLEVYKKDDNVIETYYIQNENVVKYTFTTKYSKDMNTESIITTENTTLDKMLVNINKQNYVLNIDYYINNN